METQTKSGGLIGLIAIILGLAMGVMSNPIEYPESKGLNDRSSAPATRMSIVEGPSLSATHMNAILTNTESPAAGSQHSGIDDASASALTNDGNRESSYIASVESDVSTGRAA